MAKAVARRQPGEALTAAFLLRVSDVRQAGEDRFSLAAQRRVLRERCRREGWTAGPEYVGEGESAFTRDVTKRQTIQALLRDAALGLFQILIVHDLSRFARDEELGHAVFNLLEQYGVRLVNASSDIDYSTAEGRMMLSIDLGLGSYWSRKMSMHIKKSKRERFEMGLHVGDLNFGYVKGATNKSPGVVVPDEARAIYEAFRDRAANAGYTEIARRWNGLGLTPRSKRGHTMFTASAVQSILENDFYCGFVRHNGERRKGLHEAIVSEELFLAAQAVVRRQPPKSREPRLLAGLAICVHCEGPIWQHKGGIKHTYAYYREASQRQGRPCPISGSLWPCDDAEREADAVIRDMALDEAWLAEVDREARRLPPKDDGGRAELLERKRRATTAYVEKALDEPEWKRIVQAIDDQLARMPVALPQTLAVAGLKLQSIGQLWEGMTVRERREAMRILFEQVALDTKAKKMWLQPWPEFVGLFAHRRDLCGLGTPGRTRTCAHGLGNHCSIL